MREYMKKEKYIFDADTLSHTAELAKLDISGEDAELMLSQMREIIEFAAQIFDTEPKLDAQDGRAPECAEQLREDIPEKAFSREVLMSASRYAHGDFFSVPDVLENGGAEK